MNLVSVKLLLDNSYFNQKTHETVLPLSVVSMLYTTDCIVSAGACEPDGSLQPHVWCGASGHGTILLHLLKQCDQNEYLMIKFEEIRHCTKIWCK